MGFWLPLAMLPRRVEEKFMREPRLHFTCSKTLRAPHLLTSRMVVSKLFFGGCLSGMGLNMLGRLITRNFLECNDANASHPFSLLPLNPFRIIHGLLEARRFRPVGSRPLFLLGESAFLEPDHGS